MSPLERALEKLRDELRYPPDEDLLRRAEIEATVAAIEAVLAMQRALEK